jgi:hypothetical protein
MLSTLGSAKDLLSSRSQSRYYIYSCVVCALLDTYWTTAVAHTLTFSKHPSHTTFTVQKVVWRICVSGKRYFL